MILDDLIFGMFIAVLYMVSSYIGNKVLTSYRARPRTMLRAPRLLQLVEHVEADDRHRVAGCAMHTFCEIHDIGGAPPGTRCVCKHGATHCNTCGW